MEESISSIIVFGLIVVALFVGIELWQTYKYNKERKEEYRKVMRRINFEVMKKGVE